LTATLRDRFPHDPPGHISVSAVNDYILCPLRWWGSRIAKWERPPALAPMAGTALHRAIEAYHGYEDADPETELVNRWKELKPVIAADRALGKPIKVDLGRSLDALALYVDKYPRNPMDSSEWPFRQAVPGLSVPLIGFLDLLTEDKTIRDIKTAGSMKTWTQAKADGELQATAYIWVINELIGELRPFEYVILHTGPDAPVSLTVIETTRTLDDLKAFEALLVRVHDRMQLGNEAMRATCPKGWCNHPEQCQLFQVEQRAILGLPEPVEQPKRAKVAGPQLRGQKPAQIAYEAMGR
jgi:CRISPR/Cas system-associated exonuclease Cas4 (RecB family)